MKDDEMQEGAMIIDALHVNTTGEARTKLVAANLVSVVNQKEASCLRQLSNTKRGLNELKPLTGHK